MSRCDASMFSLDPRRGSIASLEVGGNCVVCVDRKDRRLGLKDLSPLATLPV